MNGGILNAIVNKNVNANANAIIHSSIFIQSFPFYVTVHRAYSGAVELKEERSEFRSYDRRFHWKTSSRRLALAGAGALSIRSVVSPLQT